MMKSFLAGLIFVVFGNAISSAGRKEIILTLNRGVSWSAMFHAGFRPTHRRYGLYKCYQRNVVLGIRHHEGGEVLHLGKGDIEFRLLADHVLGLVVFYGRENRTIEEAEAKAEVFSEIFDETLTRKSIIRLYETGNVDIKDASSHARIGDFSIYHRFSHSFNTNKPLVERFSVALKSDVARRGKRLTSPIEPPEGYEHISLEPLLDGPDTTSDREDAVVVEDRDSRKEDAPSDGEEAPERRGMPWWALLIAAIALVGVAWVALRSRLRRGA